MLLKLLQTGEPVLRRQAQPLPVDEIGSESIQQLIALMRETMRDAPGVGLAAPQIGESIQLIVIEDPIDFHKNMTPEQLAERQREPVDFHVLINPKLDVKDTTTVTFSEGCLSVTGFYALVPRAASVHVTALNERAEPVEITAHGWYARILQHEIDHLNGVLYIDRMHRRSFTTGLNYERHWKEKPVEEVGRVLGIEPEEVIPPAARSIIGSLLGSLSDEESVAVGDVRKAWERAMQQLEAIR